MVLPDGFRHASGVPMACKLAPCSCMTPLKSLHDLVHLIFSCSVTDMVQSIAGMCADQEAASLQALQAPSQQGNDKAGLCQWQKRADGDGLELVHQHSVSHVTWHARGDYFASVAPAGNTQVNHFFHSIVLLQATTSSPMPWDN